MVTAIAIAQYQLLKLVDNTQQELKGKVNTAINACKGVERYFVTHHQSDEKTREIFKQNFMGDEILLLSELLETCYGINSEGIEEIINAIKKNIS